MQTQQRIYLTLAILAVIIILLLSFLIRPLTARIKAVSADFKEKNDSLASFEDKGTDYLARLSSEYSEIEAKISEINNYFLDSEKAIDFILAIEKVASLSGNYQEIKEVGSPASLTGGPVENSLSFQISLWGSFPNLVKFLAQLENMDYFIDINSLQISRIGERGMGGPEKKEIMVVVGDVKSVINIKIYAK